MSQALVSNTETISPVRANLRGLRRGIWRWILVDGLSLLFVFLAAIIAIDFVLDWTFALDRIQRLVMVIIAMFPLFGVLVFRLVIPLLNRPSDDALCLQVERRHKQLGEALISALQFSRAGNVEAAGLSSSMMRAAIDQGVRSAGQIPFDTILNYPVFRRNLAVLLLAILVLSGVAISVVATETMSVWFDRNVLLADRNWPQDMYLRFDYAEDGPLRIPQGADWTVSVAITEQSLRLPDEITLEVAVRESIRFEQMQPSGDRRRFQSNLKQVIEPMRLRAQSGRASTVWIETELVDYPAISKLRVEVIEPLYTGAGRRVLSPGRALDPVVEGSTLVIEGAASKPLSSARLLKPGDTEPNAASPSTPMTLSMENAFKTELSVDMDTAGKYTIALTDTEQLIVPGKSERSALTNWQAASLVVRVRLDREPSVRLQRGQIGQMITPQARIPFSAEVEEEFGLTDVRLIYRWRQQKPGDDDGAGQQTRTVSKRKIADQLDNGRVAWRDALDLVAAPLPLGTELSLQIEADDNNDRSGPKTGRSSPLRFRIISRDELRSELLQRESLVRQAISNAHRRQVGILADSQDLLRSTEDSKLPQTVFSKLGRLQKEQKRLAADLATLRDRLSLILAEVINNRLDSQDGPTSGRLTQRVIQPLDRVIETTIPKAILRLDEARRTVGRSDRHQQAIADSIDVQMIVERQLTEILDSLIGNVDFQLVLDLLQEIKANQDDVLQRSEEKHRLLIEQLFNKNDDKRNSSDSSID